MVTISLVTGFLKHILVFIFWLLWNFCNFPHANFLLLGWLFVVVWPLRAAAVANAWNYIFRINKNEIKKEKNKSQLLLCTKYANVPRAAQQIKLSRRHTPIHTCVSFFRFYFFIPLQDAVLGVSHNMEQLLQAVPKVTINLCISSFSSWMHFWGLWPLKCFEYKYINASGWRGYKQIEKLCFA